MGVRAHVISKYDIKYGKTVGFNYESESLEKILKYFCDGAFTGSEYDSDNVIWEIPRDEFKDMLYELKNINYEEYDEILNSLNIDTRNKDIIDLDNLFNILKTWENETSNNEEYIRIQWF